MKTITCLLLIMLTGKNLRAQDSLPRYIEITLTDTLMAAPAEIKGVISISGFDRNGKLKNNMQSMAITREMIKAMKLDTFEVSTSDIGIGEPGYKVTGIICTPKEWAALRSGLNDLPGITVKIIDKKAGDISADEKRLYKRMIAKAEQQAAYIAETHGKKAGPAIQISVTDIPDELGWTIYPPLSALKNGDVTETIVVRKELSVRFAW